MTLSTTLYLVRHGQTDWNVERRLQGQRDIPLNETGRKEAALLKQKLQNVHFHACFASDLSRARETAQIAIHERDLSVQLDPRLREHDYGPWEGYFSPDLAKLIQQGHPLTGMETDESVVARVLPLLREIENLHGEANILVVTHGGVIKSLLRHIVAAPRDKAEKIHIQNVGYVQLQAGQGLFKIEATDGIHIPSIT